MERPLAGPPRPGGRRDRAGAVRLGPGRGDPAGAQRRLHRAPRVRRTGRRRRGRPCFTGQRAFRPDLSVVALEDGAVVGYALAYVYEADPLANGYDEVHLGQIGVLPSARGRGLASAAIAAVLGRRGGAAADGPGSRSTAATSPARSALRGAGVPRRPLPGHLVAGPAAAGSQAVGSAHGQRRSARAALDPAQVARAHRAVELLHSHLYFAPETTSSTDRGSACGRAGCATSPAGRRHGRGRRRRRDGDLLQLLAVPRRAHDPARLDAGLARAGARRPPGRRPRVAHPAAGRGRRCLRRGRRAGRAAARGLRRC